MTLFEINQSLILKSIYPIDILHLEKYGGVFREVTIMKNNECRVDFVCKEDKISNEGELSFYFKFNSFDEMLENLQNYTGKNISEWKRCFVDVGIYYGDIPEWELAPDWDLFKKDFCEGKIEFPKNYSEFIIHDFYWQGLYSGELKYNSNDKEIEKYFRKIRENT